MKLREVKSLTQDHNSEWQRWNLSPGLCDSDAHTLSTVTLPLEIYLPLPIGNRVNDKWYIFYVYLHLY